MMGSDLGTRPLTQLPLALWKELRRQYAVCVASTQMKRDPVHVICAVTREVEVAEVVGVVGPDVRVNDWLEFLVAYFSLQKRIRL